MGSCLARLIAALVGWVAAATAVYYVLAAMGNVTDPSGLGGVLLIAVPCGAPGALLFVIIVDQFIRKPPKE
jgi:hypothetical protein